ncbi:undecaprenyl-phosphate glucose phosphotransferase [Salinarimonas sp.]|uniref:undecaprenyl-phosphate glucose phosphotransferase n=1 Tax=Salinarimonas sp. TaxID=2766526 RepID=UPI00391BA1EC
MSRSVEATLQAPASVASLGAPAYVPFYLTALVVMIADVLAGTAAFVAADALFHVVLTHGDSRPLESAIVGAQAGLVTVATIFLLRGYSGAKLRGRRPAAATFLQGWLAAFFVIGWIAFLLQQTGAASRGTVAIAFLIGVVVVLPLRILALDTFARRVRAARIATSRALVIHDGRTEGTEQLRQHLASCGVHVSADFGLHDDGETDAAARLSELVDACRAILARERIDAIYLLVPWHDVPRFQVLRSCLSRLPVCVYLFPDHHASEILRGRRIEMGFNTGYEVQRAPLDLLERARKRVFDVVVSATMLVLLAPLFAAIAVAIRLDSPGPVLFRQSRKGFSGRRFTIFKFRSMHVMEDGPVVTQASRGDARVTRVGAFLRRSSLDELPQLLNVLRGEMSLVGPRPHALAHDDHYEKLIASYAARHHVKPGLTGWAQVNGCRGATPEIRDMEARIAYDLWYIDNWTLWLDLRIIARTALIVLHDRNAY